MAKCHNLLLPNSGETKKSLWWSCSTPEHSLELLPPASCVALCVCLCHKTHPETAPQTLVTNSCSSQPSYEAMHLLLLHCLNY